MAYVQAGVFIPVKGSLLETCCFNGGLLGPMDLSSCRGAFLINDLLN
jgi:hypothetical protein